MDVLANSVKAVNHIVPDQRAAGTVNGAAGIDTVGVEEVTFVISVGAADAGLTTFQVKVYESATGSGDWAAISGAETPSVADLGSADNMIAMLAVRTGGRASARKRYLRATATIGGSGNCDLAVIALVKPVDQPATNTISPVVV